MITVAFIPYGISKGKTEQNAQLIEKCAPVENLNNRVGQARVECPYCDTHSLDIDYGDAQNNSYVRCMCHTCRTIVLAVHPDKEYEGSDRGGFVRTVYQAYVDKVTEMYNANKEAEVLVWNV